MAIKLCDSSDSDGDDISNIQINQEFARRYEHNKKREDLQRLEELENNGFVDDDDDEESSEDVSEDDGVDNKELVDLLIKFKRKDPILKNKDTVLFESNNSSDDDEVSDDEKAEMNIKEKKKTYLKDLPAKHLNKDGAAMGYDEDDDEEMVVSGGKSYVEEQQELTKPFLEDDEEEEDGGGFFKPKERSDDEEDENDEEGEVGKKLDEYFGPDEKLDENDKYIKEYIRKKMWLDKSDRKVFDEDDDIGVSDDEEEVERQEDYERGFNFRFEEDPGDRVLGYSRVVEGSVRKKSNTRKLQRERKEERIAQAEYERKEELKRLKNLKKKELKEKLKKIRETAGIGEGGVCRIDLDDLEDEFVPQKYDRKMNVTFDDGYYEANDADPDFASDGGEEDIEKPDFDKEDELLGLPKGWDDMDSSRDGFKAARERILLKQRVEKEGVVDAAESEPKKKQKMSALEKEVLNEQLDEYYKLDYEDTIGDLKTRFRYRPVNAKRFGLKTKEVLLLDDKDLNQHVPLKKLAPYREKEWKVPRIKIYNQKMKIKSLLEGETSGVHNTGKRKYRDEETSKDVGKLYQEESKSSKRRHRQASFKLSQSRLKAYGKNPSKSKSKRQN